MALRTPLTVSPHLYMGDSTGRPLDNGMVYFGQTDKDPEFYPIDIFLDEELTIPIMQPVRTKGGFLSDKGDMVEIHAAEVTYSVKVCDSYGRKIMYKGEMFRNNVSDFLVDEIARAINKENIIAASVVTEKDRAIAAENVVAAAVVSEKDRAVAAEGVIDAKVVALAAKDVELETLIGSIAGGKKAYTTEALMIADKANIPANSSVDVTNDTDTAKNGTYAYNGTVFTKSNYDVLALAKADALKQSKESRDYILSSMSDSGIELYTNIRYTTINGKVVNNNYDVSGGLQNGIVGGKAIRVNVSEVDGFYVAGSVITASAGWYWVFTDASFGFVSKTLHAGDGYVEVPVGAVNADRTFSDSIISETDKFALQLVKNTKKDLIDSTANALQSDLVGDRGTVVFRDGALVEMSENPALPILNAGAGRKFVKVVGLENYKSLDVSWDVAGSNIAAVWNWLFIFPDGSKKIANGTATSNSVEIPEGAVIGYKSVHAPAPSTNTTKDLVIKPILKSDYTAKAINRLEHELKILSADSPISARSVVNINDFEAATQTEQLKQAVAFVKFRGRGVIEITRDKKRDTDVWLMTEAILLPSNCWIYINNVTVQKAPKVFDNIFRNEGIVPNADPHGFATELNENRNIRIFGNDKRYSRIRGNMDDPYVGVNPVSGLTVPFLGDVFGWRTFCVLFANTKDFHIHNLRYDKTNGWANSNEHGCEDFSYHDLFFDTAGKNSDGVDIRLGCKNFKVYNIEGTTRDDMVACSALANFAAAYPVNQYVYSSEIGGTADRGFGIDISHGDIYNIIGDNANEALLLLATGGSKIHDISVSDIKDRDGGFAIAGMHILGRGYGQNSVMGAFYNITVSNIDTKKTKKPMIISAPLKDSWINKVHKGEGDSSTPPITLAAYTDLSNTVLTNIKQL